MKSIIASGLLLGMAHGAAIAGPYVNIEGESKFDGMDATGSIIRNDVGYEGRLGDAKYYVQGGPALVFPDGGTVTTEASAKAGVKMPVTERLGVYGEVKAITQDGINLSESLKLSSKVGVKYTF